MPQLAKIERRWACMFSHAKNTIRIKRMSCVVRTVGSYNTSWMRINLGYSFRFDITRISPSPTLPLDWMIWYWDLYMDFPTINAQQGIHLFRQHAIDCCFFTWFDSPAFQCFNTPRQCYLIVHISPSFELTVFIFTSAFFQLIRHHL